MRRCIDWYFPAGARTVVDLGSMNVNGSYADLLPCSADYIGVDLDAGPGVDVVLSDVYALPFQDNSVDVVLTGQMLEHCGQFWRVFQEIARILKPGGLAFAIAPSAGPVHRYPVDCYRFYPDSYQAIADWSKLRVVHCWVDERGPWRDFVGVFQRDGQLQPINKPPAFAVAANELQDLNPDPAVEVRAGARPYLQVLRDLHSIVKPKLYLEIGVRKGASVALAEGPAIAVDPDPHADFTPPSQANFYRCTSDDFFFFHGATAFERPVELAFIDGMHLAEYVYRDFMNVERVMAPDGVIVIDDVLPNHPVQARRTRESRVWTGDVWRFAALLAERRPDLQLTWLDTDPTGLLVVTKLKPKNRRLWDDYNKAIRRLDDEADAPVPESLIARQIAVAPTAALLRSAAGR